MGHKKALIIVLVGVVAAAVISIFSFAATTTTSTVSVTAFGGLAGEFGFVVSQAETSTTTFSSDNDGDTLVVIVGAGANNFAVGDYLLIDSDSDGDGSTGTASFHTVTARDGDTLTVAPDISKTYLTGSVSEPVVYPDLHSWIPARDSATSVTAGNHFIVNLKGLQTSDDAFVELLTVNPNELVKNYTYLNRTIGVYVLCDSTDGACTATEPYRTGVASGSWDDALDSSGTDVNATADILTLTNARQQFVLTGGYVYAITVEGGALYTIDTTTGSGDRLSPTDQIEITAR